MTRFLVLGRQQAEPTGRDKTSILIVTRDEPGILYRTLGAFAERGLNMTKIESRPSRRRPWEYVFFLDIDGHQRDARRGRCDRRRQAGLRVAQGAGLVSQGRARRRRMTRDPRR